MTTENGLPTPRRMRAAIERLRDRRAYLQSKLDRRAADGYPVNEFDRQEIFALDWALPVLEAEWDSTVRLRKMAGFPERDETPKTGSAHGTPHSLRPSFEPGVDIEPHEWWCKCGHPLVYNGKRRAEASKELREHRRSASAESVHA